MKVGCGWSEINRVEDICGWLCVDWSEADRLVSVNDWPKVDWSQVGMNSLWGPSQDLIRRRSLEQIGFGFTEYTREMIVFATRASDSEVAK